MAQYIDKAVIVMVIEKLIAKYKEISVGVDKKGNDWVDSVSMLNAKIDTLQSLLSTISSLEVKEVDLEKEIETLDSLLYDLDGVAVKGTTSYLTVEDVKDIAQHFFELGLKDRKENKNYGRKRL